jgi:hypothetical protein
MIQNLFLFIVGLVLVVVGHGMSGALGLGTMLLGLSSMISMIYFYNRKFR